MNDKHYLVLSKWSKIASIVFLVALLQGCDSGKLGSDIIKEPEAVISKFDGQPIIELSSLELINSSIVEKTRDQVVQQLGADLLEAFQEQKLKFSENEIQSDIFLISELKTKRKSLNQISTHFRVIDEEGSSEEFLLAVRMYEKGKSRNKSIASVNSEDTWVALDPDKFYLDDDEYGQEIWPVTYEAVHLIDPSRKMEITFDKTGLIAATEIGKAKSQSTINSLPDLMIIDAVAVIEEPCLENPESSDCGEPGGGGTGGGSNPGRIDDDSRGESTGSYTSNAVHLVMKSITMAVDGDGGGGAELQFFSRKNDDFTHNFGVSYKYRFDRVAGRYNPINPYSHNQIIQGSDFGGFYDRWYNVPDINNEGVRYSFDNITMYTKGTLVNYYGHVGIPVDGFPLINLTQTGGPWRFVLVDDDKDYPDFSTRRSSTRIEQTYFYNLLAGVWQLVSTGYTTRRHTNGSSDDPLLDSGVRQITLQNANLRMNGSNGLISLSRNSLEGGTFRYELGLRSEPAFYSQTYSNYP